MTRRRKNILIRNIILSLFIIFLIIGIFNLPLSFYLSGRLGSGLGKIFISESAGRSGNFVHINCEIRNLLFTDTILQIGIYTVSNGYAYPLTEEKSVFIPGNVSYLKPNVTLTLETTSKENIECLARIGDGICSSVSVVPFTGRVVCA